MTTILSPTWFIAVGLIEKAGVGLYPRWMENPPCVQLVLVLLCQWMVRLGNLAQPQAQPELPLGSGGIWSDGVWSGSKQGYCAGSEGTQSMCQLHFLMRNLISCCLQNGS